MDASVATTLTQPYLVHPGNEEIVTQALHRIAPPAICGVLTTIWVIYDMGLHMTVGTFL